MIDSKTVAAQDHFLTDAQIIETIQTGLKRTLDHQRVLVLIPDHTRSLPLPFLFHALVEILRGAQHSMLQHRD